MKPIELEVSSPLDRGGSSSNLSTLPLPLPFQYEQLSEQQLRDKIRLDHRNLPILMPEYRQRLKWTALTCSTSSCLLHNFIFSYIFAYVDQQAALYYAFSLAMCITAPILGYIASVNPIRFNLKNMMVGSLAVQGILVFLFGFLGFSRDLDTFLGIGVTIRVFQGISSAIAHISAFSAIALVYPKYSGTTYGLFLTITLGIGLLDGTLFGELLYKAFDLIQNDKASVDLAFLLTSLTFAVITLLLAVFIKYYMMFIPITLRNSTLKKRNSSIRFCRDVKRIFSTRGILLNLVIITASLGVLAFLISSLPQNLRNLSRGLNDMNAGIAFIVAAAAFVIMSPGTGWLIKKIGLRAAFAIGLIFILIALQLLSRGVIYLAEAFSSDTDEHLKFSRRLIYAALIMIGSGLSLTVNPAIPEILSIAKLARVANGAIEVSSSLATSSIAFGIFLGTFIGGIVVSNLGFKEALDVISILFGIILIWQFIDVLFHRMRSEWRKQNAQPDTTDLDATAELEIKAIEEARGKILAESNPMASKNLIKEITIKVASKKSENLRAMELPSLKSYTESEKKIKNEQRSAIFKELVETETSYVIYLKAFLNFYLTPLKQMTISKDSFLWKSLYEFENVDHVFVSNSREILALYNQIQTFCSLHSVFLQALKEISEDNPDESLSVFKRYTDFFRLYGDYSVEYGNRLALIGKLSRSKIFQKFIKKVDVDLANEKLILDTVLDAKTASPLRSRESIALQEPPRRDTPPLKEVLTENQFQPESVEVKIQSEENKNIELDFNISYLNFRQTLQSYLIMPIQRIPRYLLLLKEILKNSVEDELFTQWMSVLQQVEQVCSRIDKSSSERDESIKVLNIQNRIAGLEFSLVAPHRKLLAEGSALRVGASTRNVEVFEVMLYLFSDIIVWTSKSHQFKGHIELAGSKIYSVLPADILPENRANDVRLFVGDSMKSQRSLHILGVKNPLIPITLIFESSESKSYWETLLQDSIMQANQTIQGVIHAIKSSKAI